MKVTAIVTAAGESRRMKKREKIFISLCGKPLITYALEVLNNFSIIDEIILVVSRVNQERVRHKIVKKYHLGKITQIVIGGATRTDSVCKGLKKVSEETDFVLIHDGARPFIEEKMIATSLQGAKRFGAAIVGVPVSSTIKKVREGLFVDSTLAREELWEIQTPQVFKAQLIKEAYHKAQLEGIQATDDSSLVERIGHKVKIVVGSYNNIKITTPEDLTVAEAILRRHKLKNGYSTIR
jgi:2-C-methyl-D-erythritol 4-phosphate cytidylyltransferase